MGCWEGTCMISQLPIFEDDKVVLIPIIKSGDINKILQHSMFDTHELYKPIPIVLHGKYDSYGCIYNIKGNVNKFMHIMKRLLIEKNESQKEKIENATIKELIRIIKRGYCPDIAFVMILEPFWKVSSNYTNWWTMDKKYSIIETSSNQCLYLTKEYSKYIKIKSINKNFESNNKYIYSDKDVEDIIRTNDFLFDLNKYWMPQLGSGRQVDYEVEKTPHQILIELMSDIENKREKERLSDQ